MLARVKTMKRRRHAVRYALMAAIALAVAGCAKEEPPETNYQSLKDTWAERTTVSYAPPPEPLRTVAAPARKTAKRVREDATAGSPAVRVPEQPKVTAPKPQAPKASPPDLALSSPTPSPPPVGKAPPPINRPQAAPVTPQAQPKPLTESDLAGDTTRCGVGVDCLAVLRAMISDPQQSWMARTPTLADFTNGTRLFAYRALRTTLDCGKLRFANAELDWAVDTFSGILEGVDAPHRARVAALAAAVRLEIQAEIKTRC
jgi:hypothetical protein